MSTPFETIKRLISDRFSQYIVRMEQVPDSPLTVAVSVYGVKPDDREDVRAMIHEMDWKYCQPSRCAVLARIVDEATTAKYYPELLPSRTTARRPWSHARRACALFIANSELAMAA